MTKEYSFAQYLELDDAAKKVLTDGVQELRKLGLDDEAAIDTFEAKIASDLDSLPKTTFAELKERSDKALELHGELKKLTRTVTPEAHAADLAAIKANLIKMGVRTASVVGAQPDY